MPSPCADSRACVSICPCDVGTEAAFVQPENQEWPFAGFSLFAVFSKMRASVCLSDELWLVRGSSAVAD